MPITSGQNIDPTEILKALAKKYCGDGSDGTILLDGTNTFAFLTKSGNTYTMTRDIYGTTITINTGVTLITKGYRIYASVLLTGAGTLKYGVPNNGATGSYGFPGAATVANTAVGLGFFKDQAGGGSNVTPTQANASVSGGGTVASVLPGKVFFNTLNGVDTPYVVPLLMYPYVSGVGGKGGVNNTGSGGIFLWGGGGGTGGGIIWIMAYNVTGTFLIVGQGGNGGYGADDGSRGISSGPGNGGDGSSVIMCFFFKTWTGTYTLTGGVKGTNSTYGGLTATNGANGTAFEYNMLS